MVPFITFIAICLSGGFLVDAIVQNGDKNSKEQTYKWHRAVPKQTIKLDSVEMLRKVIEDPKSAAFPHYKVRISIICCHRVSNSHCCSP